MSVVSDRLYGLIPEAHRLRDGDAGEPLRTLLRIVERELNALEGDVAQMYEDWFIETCDDWLVPYIGDLLGAGVLHEQAGAGRGRRAYVANTIAYRRRKGTAAVLEQLARDLTGSPARAVEYFRLVATTQHLGHPDTSRFATADLRDGLTLELLGGPLERVAHSAEVRSIASRRGRYGVANLGLFVSRIESYPVERAEPRAFTNPPDGRFTFDPLGRSIPLHNRPLPERDIAHLAEEQNLAVPLRRRPLHDELEARRTQEWQGGTGWFRRRVEGSGEESSVIEVYVEGKQKPLAPEEIVVCHLGTTPSAPDWRRPPVEIEYKDLPPKPLKKPIRAAVDPVLGRLSFRANDTVAPVRVSFSYGFGGDIGGGPYDRTESYEAWRPDDVSPWQIGVTKDPALLASSTVKAPIVDKLGKAISAWNTRLAQSGPAPFGIISILDSASYAESLTAASVIEIPAEASLAIVAAGWHTVESRDGISAPERVPGLIDPDARRPHLDGDLSVKGTAAAGADPGTLILDGLLIEGRVTVLVGNLGGLLISHCTLAAATPPGTSQTAADGDVTVNASTASGAGSSNGRLRVQVTRSLCGRIELSDRIGQVSVADSLVDRPGMPAIVAPGGRAELEGVTVLGGVAVRELDASNCIFTELALADRRQSGCVRYSYLPPGSRTTQPYRCQPALALATQPERSADSLRPVFASTRGGDPLYGRLATTCPSEIRGGADDEGEMGAFNFLRETQREANVRASLDEYLSFGLDAGVLHLEGEQR